MAQVSISGAITGGPPVAGEGFPASLFNTSLAFLINPKGFSVGTGILARQLNSPSGFATLTGVGASDTVTHGDTLYFKCNGAVTLRLTQDDGIGGSAVHDIDVQGLVVLEFPSTKYLKSMSAQGSCQIEYFVSGQS